MPAGDAQREISAETQSRPWRDDRQSRGGHASFQRPRIDLRLLAADARGNDRFVQFLAGDRLVQNTMTAGGGLLDARRRGIAGDDNGRDRAADMGAKSLDCVQAGSTVSEPVVGDDQVDRRSAGHDCLCMNLLHLDGRSAGIDAMPLQREQLHHDIENIALVFHDHDADGDACGRRPVIGQRSFRRSGLRNRNGKHRTASSDGDQLQRMLQQCRQERRADSRGGAGSSVRSPSPGSAIARIPRRPLLADLRGCQGRYPRSGFDSRASRGCGIQNAAGSRISKGVRQQIAQDPFQHHGIAVHLQAAFQRHANRGRDRSPLARIRCWRWSKETGTDSPPPSQQRRRRHRAGDVEQPDSVEALEVADNGFCLAGQIACIAGIGLRRGDPAPRAWRSADSRHGSAGAGHDWRPQGNAFSHDRRLARGRAPPRGD